MLLKIGHKIVCGIPLLIMIFAFFTTFNEDYGTSGIVIFIATVIAYIASRSGVLKLFGFSEALAITLSILSSWTLMLLPFLIFEVIDGNSLSKDPSFPIVTFALVAACVLCIVIHIFTRKKKKKPIQDIQNINVTAEDPAPLEPLTKTPAYSGVDPYIFISYSHKDDRIVIPIVNLLKDRNYRVWYDEGIGTGTTWDENIAQHIKNCEVFVAFHSYNYKCSENCNVEMKHAVNCSKKNRFIVFLDDSKLSDGNEMYYNVKQNLFLSRYPNYDALINAMSTAEGFEACLDLTDVQ